MQWGVRSAPHCQDGFVLQNTSCVAECYEALFDLTRLLIELYAEVGVNRHGSRTPIQFNPNALIG